jgi:superfamily II DNA helicase RecQ
MTMHFFAIPALDPDGAQAALDAFCRAHRVVDIERQFAADGPRSFWAVCVTVAAGPGPLPAALKKPTTAAAAAPGLHEARVDYKQLLRPADFVVFAALRQWRKAAAEREGVPLYAVFSNEQLAQMATRRCTALAEVEAIDGVGPARVRKYGDEVLTIVRDAATAAPADDSHDPSRAPHAPHDAT